MKSFLDTSALIAVFDEADKNHQKAKIFWEQILKSRRWTEILISDYILDEIVTRIRSQIGHRTALQIINILLELVRKNKLNLIWIERKYFYNAKNIFEQYDDQEFSFTDCTSFDVCKDLNIPNAFAFDEDFDIFGLIRHPL